MRLDDYCCLGRTVPEESKKYGKRVCSAGYSEELRQLVRVYPLPVVCDVTQRSVSTLELRRKADDSRQESWKLDRDAANSGIVSVGKKRDRDEVIDWLAKRVNPSIAWLNERRLSLGVIRPTGLTPYFRERSTGRNADPSQLELFADLDESFGDQATRFAPYLRFEDAAGKHRLQLREWGCYECVRKNPGNENQLWLNLRLDAEHSDVLLLVGNMCHQRTTWLVINVFARKPVLKERDLFSEDQP